MKFVVVSHFLIVFNMLLGDRNKAHRASCFLFYKLLYFIFRSSSMDVILWIMSIVYRFLGWNIWNL